MAADVRLVLPQDLSSVPLGRQATATHLSELPSDLVEDACLIVTELVGNAVRHGHGAITLTLTMDDAGVLMTVAADSELDPEPRYASPDEASGRGLAIVEALAADWGWHRDRGAVTVWARITPG